MKTSSTRRRSPAKALSLLLLTLALAMVLAVAACESDDDPTATPSSGGSDSATEQSSSSTDNTVSDSTQTDSSGDSGMDGDPLAVVTTTNIVADWVRNVGGDRVEVMSLLPVGGDPHTYQPGARDVANIVDADLVLTVGLGLEGAWLEELIHNASADESRIVALAGAVNPIEFAETGGHDEEEEEMGHEELTGRLLISDGELPALSVLDLTTEQLDQLSLPVAAPGATLYTSPSGRFAFALARGAGDDAAADDRVHIFDGGVYLEEHDGHLDLVTEPVSQLTVGTTDNRPIHFSRHSGWTAIFHDGSGRIALFEEHDLEEELNEYEPVWLEAGLQQGAGIALGEGYVMVTSNNPEYPDTASSSLPLGAEVWTLDGEVVFDEPARACPALQGEASNAHGIGFGCAGGVLFIEGHDGEYEYEFVENPADMNAAARIGTLWGHGDTEVLFGTASYTHDGESVYDGLWLIDVEGGEMTRVLPPQEEKRVLNAAFDGHGEELFVLTYDGVLNVIDVEHGEVEETYELVEAFDADTSPSFIVVGELLYLSDRVGGRIIEFSLEEGEIERDWAISGEPRSLAFVGLGVEESEDESVDHGHGPLDPHFWFDPNRVRDAVIDIATRLAIMDPAGAETYTANATAYVAQLEELHGWTEQQVAEIPVENRILVTSHDSLSYFAVVYGFEVVGTVIPGGTTETESSAEQLAELIEIVEHEGVAAVFGETTITERVARAVAEETGAGFYSLYSGSLGAVGSGADTFITMVRANVETIVEALS